MSRSRDRLLVFAVLCAVLFGFGVVRRRPHPDGLFHGVVGHRGIPIVLVHGLGSRSQDWMPVARRLGRDHRVVLVELPGHGDSPMSDDLSLASAARAVDHAIEAETRDRVVLVGHSVGGLVAMAVALRDPERVRGLVLVETALRPQTDRQGREAIRRALDHGYDALLRSAYQEFGRDSAQGAALYATARACDSTAMKQWIRLATQEDLSADAAAIRCPVLEVLAARSWPDSEPWPVTARALGVDRISRIEPLRLSRCGHFVMLDRPADVAAAIERFTGSLDATLADAR